MEFRSPPLVSVILPTFNRALFIGDAVRSVLGQTFTRYEIIVVDDGSSDDTREVIKSFNGPIRYFFQENGGPSSARNSGLRNSSGEFVAFLDSDDIFYPHKLEMQIDYFSSHPEVGMVYSSYVSADENLNEIDYHPAKVHGWIHRNLLVKCSIATPTVMAKREVFNEVGYFDEEMSIGEDIDMWIRVSRQYAVGAIDVPLSKVRIHEDRIPRDAANVLANKKYMVKKHLQTDRSIGFINGRRFLAGVYLEAYGLSKEDGGVFSSAPLMYLYQAFLSSPLITLNLVLRQLFASVLALILPKQIYERLRSSLRKRA